MSDVIFDQDRIRIVMTRLDNKIHLDVEVSGPVLSVIPEHNENEITAHSRKAALRSIELLKYIVKLADNGFSLFAIDFEFLWTASIVLQETPGETFFELLQPPSINQ